MPDVHAGMGCTIGTTMTMVEVILSHMGLTPVEQFTTIHNYIDTDNMILRKGAVAAYAGQTLLNDNS